MTFAQFGILYLIGVNLLKTLCSFQWHFTELYSNVSKKGLIALSRAQNLREGSSFIDRYVVFVLYSCA